MESGLYCELTDKTLHDGYIEYILLYDMIANRITIDEARAENGCLRLMKNLVWEKDVHTIISFLKFLRVFSLIILQILLLMPL